jgi:aldehyde dehydrogenase (NAD+)
MKDELCEGIEKDLGRGAFYGYISEIHLIKVEIQHTIDHLKTWMKETVVDTPVIVGPGKSFIQAEPLGVICVMAAWNYPYYTLMGPASQVIAAGNCCILKPSELSPNCSNAITKLCKKYLDPKYYKVIEGKAEVSKKLTSMRFDMIVFTGST